MLLLHHGQMRKRTTLGDLFFSNEAQLCFPSSQYFFASRYLQQTDQYQCRQVAWRHAAIILCDFIKQGFAECSYFKVQTCGSLCDLAKD